MSVLSRVLLFAEADDAAEIVGVLSALNGTDVPSWLPYVRRDGTESTAATVRIGDLTVDVAIGTPALPAVLEVIVPALPAAMERILDAGFSLETGQRDGDLEAVTVEVGGLRIAAASEAALLDRRGVDSRRLRVIEHGRDAVWVIEVRPDRPLDLPNAEATRILVTAESTDADISAEIARCIAPYRPPAVVAWATAEVRERRDWKREQVAAKR